jgi:pyruvate kinase
MRQLRKKRGALSELAFKLGIRPQATHLWRRVPLDRVGDVSKILGVPKAKIRPDHYTS